MFPFTVARAPAPQRQVAGTAVLLERARSLRESGERVAAGVLKALQALAGPLPAIAGGLGEITEASVKDFVGSHRPEAVAAVLHSGGLGCPLVARLNPALVHALVELLAGGNGSEPPPTTPRAATAIDAQFSLVVLAILGQAIEAEWAGFGFGTMRAARLDGGLAADSFGAGVTTLGVVNFKIELFGLHGKLSLALPPAALAAFAETGAAPEDEDAGGDPGWEHALHRELGLAPVRLQAFLQAEPMPLGAVAGLAVGQILALSGASHGRVALVGDGRVLFRGDLGQEDDRFSVRIDGSAAAALAPPAVPADADPPAGLPPVPDFPDLPDLAEAFE